ncbi:MAG: DUF6776 family protein [Saccharospirillum sp.]
MAKVKVKPVRRMTVVPYRPWRRAMVQVTGTVIFVAAIAGAYRYGLEQGLGSHDVLVAERDALRDDLAQSQQLQDALRLRVTLLERGSEVDRQANEDVRQVNRELASRIARLEEEVALYQGIMSPALEGEGLRVQELRLTPTSAERRYRYQLMLTQVGDNSDDLQGFVGVNLVGTQDGERVAIALKDISEEIDEVDIQFRYRYFQDFRGDLVLPEGFTPDQIQVVAQAVGNRSARVEMTYNWSDLESGNYVGQQE